MSNYNQIEINELLKSFLINTACLEERDQLGIFKFAKFFFPSKFYADFSPVHWNMVQLLASLYDPDKERRIERQAAFLVHREAAKSTVGNFLFPMYLTYFQNFTPKFALFDDKNEKIKEFTHKIDERYFLICSESAMQSEQFVSNIKDEISTNRKLASIFGERSPKRIVFEDEDYAGDNKWTRNNFIVPNVSNPQQNIAFRGVGIGQKVRGTQFRSQRPTFIIVDDMYSKNNTITEVTRTKMNYWFEAELLNSLDSVTGKMLWLGTLVHPDTVVKTFKKSPNWSLIDRPIISQEELSKSIKKWYNPTSGQLKGDKKEIIEWSKTNIKTLSWADRHDLHYILSLYAEKRRMDQLSWFYQEYMNEPFAPETRVISEETFYKTDSLKFHLDKGQQKVSFNYKNREWYGACNLYMGIDPASSSSEKSDDTVIVVAGMARVYPKVKGHDEQSALYKNESGLVVPVIAHIEGGKYAIYKYKELPSMAEAVVKLDKQFNLKQIRMETNAQQEQIAREVEKSLKTGIRGQSISDDNYMSVVNDDIMPSGKGTMFWREVQSMNKAERIGQILHPIAHNYEAIICQDNFLIDKVYFQLLSLGIGDHDDYADATAIAMKNMIVPDKIKTDYDSYEQNRKKRNDKPDIDDWYLS